MGCHGLGVHRGRLRLIGRPPPAQHSAISSSTSHVRHGMAVAVMLATSYRCWTILPVDPRADAYLLGTTTPNTFPSLDHAPLRSREGTVCCICTATRGGSGLLGISTGAGRRRLFRVRSASADASEAAIGPRGSPPAGVLSCASACEMWVPDAAWAVGPGPARSVTGGAGPVATPSVGASPCGTAGKRAA